MRILTPTSRAVHARSRRRSPAPAHRRPSPHRRGRLAALLLVPVLAAGGSLGGAALAAAGASASASARMPFAHGSWRSLYGIVGTVGSDSFSLSVRLRNGATSVVTVDVSLQTRYREPSVHGAGLGDVTQGLTVGVRGRVKRSDPTVIHAVLVFIAPAKTSAKAVVSHEQGSPVSMTGIAEDVGVDGFTLQRHGYAVRVKVLATTQFFESGVASPSFVDVTDGTALGVTAVVDPSSGAAEPLLDADAVYIGLPAIGALGPGGSKPDGPTGPSGASGATTTTSTPPHTVKVELPPGGAVSAITPSSFVYTLGPVTATVMIEPSTIFFLGDATTSATSLSLPGITAGVAGVADPQSTDGNEIVDARHVYLAEPGGSATSTSEPSNTEPRNTEPPTSSPSTSEPSNGEPTTSQPSGGAPGGSSSAEPRVELPPGGTASDITATSFVYTNGSSTATVKIEPTTLFFLGNASATAASLGGAGVTVGVAGILDPSSTAAALVVDALHVYLTA